MMRFADYIAAAPRGEISRLMRVSGVAASTLHDLLKGRRVRRSKTAYAIAAATEFRVSFEDVLGPNPPDSSPAQRAAWAETNRALRAGTLIRPRTCERCGKTPEGPRQFKTTIQAHHEDYARPLDVTWLCPRCHRGRHAELRRAA